MAIRRTEVKEKKNNNDHLKGKDLTTTLKVKNEEIKLYIDKLNSNEQKDMIFLRQIHKSVEVARVWEKEPELNDVIGISISSYRFFFIKNENGKYIGAVLDMNQDLHWYVLREERKKGFLTNAMRETILPYIFYDEYHEKNIQRITIEHGIGEENYKNSKKVAEKLGFKPVNDSSRFAEIKMRKKQFV